ncbi:histidine kinase dimerization/phospho-acceptor domain-containing protein [Massilia sp. BHUDP2]
MATLSHELRNPLAPMRSSLDVLTLKFAHGLPDMNGYERARGAQ